MRAKCPNCGNVNQLKSLYNSGRRLGGQMFFEPEGGYRRCNYCHIWFEFKTEIKRGWETVMLTITRPDFNIVNEEDSNFKNPKGRDE
jgi:hypothetical protein